MTQMNSTSWGEQEELSFQHCILFWIGEAAQYVSLRMLFNMLQGSSQTHRHPGKETVTHGHFPEVLFSFLLIFCVNSS